MGDFIERQDHTNPEMPDMVILHMGTNDLPFLHDHPGFLNSTVKQHLQIAKELKQRYMGIELMVSMPLPRLDKYQGMRSHYSCYLSSALAKDSISFITWDDYPTENLSMDLLHPSQEQPMKENKSPPQPMKENKSPPQPRKENKSPPQPMKENKSPPQPMKENKSQFICFKCFVKAVLGAVTVRYSWIIYL